MHSAVTLTVSAVAAVAEVALSYTGRLPVPGFTFTWEARQCMESNRVQHGSAYGLAVRLGLLSTPSLDDAVTSGYGHPVLCPKGTCTPLLVCAFRRTIAGFQPWRILRQINDSGH
jgi:hypothetical protein